MLMVCVMTQRHVCVCVLQTLMLRFFGYNAPERLRMKINLTHVKKIVILLC